MRKNNYWIILILLSAIFLRFYRIEETFIYVGEVGHNLLAIKNAYLMKQIPLLGPPTSHSWLYFGPLFYWIYGPVLILSGFNPLSHAYFGAFFSVLIVLVNYLVIKKLINEKIALMSSLLIATSPLFMEFSRNARFFSLVTLLVYPFLYLLHNLSTGKSKAYFLLGLLFGFMFSFHFTPLMLIPFAVSVFLIKRVALTKKDLFKLISGFILSMSPFFIYDITHSLSMTKNVLLWVPYRILGFIGLYPKNTVSPVVVRENIMSLNDFLTKSFIPAGATYISAVFLLAFTALCFWLIIGFRRKTFPFVYKFIFLWFLWGIIAVFIHGSPPIHYFVPILPTGILLVAIFLYSCWQHRLVKVLVACLLLIVTFINVRYYFSDKWFFKDNTKMTVSPYYVPYGLQQKVASAIIADAGSGTYSLRRIGDNDQFENDYAENYIFLLWLYGNEPVKSSNITYTIQEITSGRKIRAVNNGEILQISNITLKKSIIK